MSTTGPWHWKKARTVRHLHNKDGNVAEVSMPARSPQGFEGRYESVAALIAAAPSLAEALAKLIVEPGNLDYRSQGRAALALLTDEKQSL